MKQTINKADKVVTLIADNAIDKVIITTFSPFITPFGAIIVAKLKGLIAIVLIYILFMLAIIIIGGGNQDSITRQNSTNPRISTPSNIESTVSGQLPSGIGYKALNVPYINQWLNKDGTYSPRNKIPFADNWELGWMTCGAASSVMVSAYYGKLTFTDDKNLKEYTYQDRGKNLPNYCGEFGIPGGAFGVTARGYCNQSSFAGITEYLGYNGLKVRNMGYSFSNVVNSINNGKPLIMSISAPLGHLLVIKGYTEDGRVIVNDSFGDESRSFTDYSFSGENAIYDLESGLFAVTSINEISLI